MSYSDGCSVPRVNYFSNPDVTYLNKPTGDAQNNNAQCIRDRMVRLIDLNALRLAG